MQKSLIQYLRLLAIVILCAFSLACSNVKSDAKKAAQLTNKSIKQAEELKLDASEKTYKKAQKLIKKYDGHKKEDAFQSLYKKYRDADAPQNR